MLADFLHWPRLAAIVMAVPLLADSALAGTSGFHRLRAQGIRAQVIGNTVTDDAHWADRFRADGVLDGHELGEAKRGAWRIERDELCITREARRPVPECFEIWVKGDEVEYRRDGVAVVTGNIRREDR